MDSLESVWQTLAWKMPDFHRGPRRSWIWLKERILAFLHINGVDATRLISNLYKFPGLYTWDVLARMHRDQEPNSSVNHIIVTSGTTFVRRKISILHLI